MCFLQFALVSDEPKVFLPKYSKTVILHAAHFRRVVELITFRLYHCSSYIGTLRGCGSIELVETGPFDNLLVIAT